MTLRATAWRSTTDPGAATVHLVNYDVHVAPLKADIHDPTTDAVPPTPALDVTATIPVGPGMSVTAVVAADPWHPDPVSLRFDVRGSAVRFTVPRIDIYRVVRIS